MVLGDSATVATLKEMSHLAQPKLTNVRLAIKVLLIILHFVFIVFIYCFQFAVCRSNSCKL